MIWKRVINQQYLYFTNIIQASARRKIFLKESNFCANILFAVIGTMTVSSGCRWICQLLNFLKGRFYSVKIQYVILFIWSKVNKSPDRQTPLSLKIRQSIEICKLHEGDIFGEESNFVQDNPKRFFRAVCTRSKSEVYMFNYSQFQDYLSSNQSASLYLKCVYQIYNERFALTEAKIKEKSAIMEQSRYVKTQSRSPEKRADQAVCHTVDEKGFIDGNQFDQNFYNALTTPYEQLNQYEQNKEKDKLNGQSHFDHILFQNPQIQSSPDLQRIKSYQQIYTSLIFQPQKESNNSITKSPMQNGYPNLRLEGQQNLLQLSDKLKVQAQISKTSLISLNNLQDQTSNQKSPFKKPIIAQYINIDFENHKLSLNTVKENQQLDQKPQTQEIISKPKLLKIKQIKQSSSSIRQNINFFREQNEPINCLTLFQKFNQIQNTNNNVNHINNYINDNTNNNTTSKNNNNNNQKQQIGLISKINELHDISELNKSPHISLERTQTKDIQFISQIQIFNNQQNFPCNEQNNKNKIILPIQCASSKMNEDLTSEISNTIQDGDQEDDNQKDYLKSKIWNRKRAISLSPTKKQIKVRNATQQNFHPRQNQNSNITYEINQSQQVKINKSNQEKCTTCSCLHNEKSSDNQNSCSKIINSSKSNNNINDKSNNKDNKNMTQQDLSTKNTSRQSTSSHFKAIECNSIEGFQNQQINQSVTKQNVFYFNSHYLNDDKKERRLNISKNMSINNLSKIMNQSQNLKKQTITQNRSASELSFDKSKIAISQTQIQTKLNCKNLINTGKYKIVQKEQIRPSSACRLNSMRSDKNSNYSIQGIQKEQEQISPQKNTLSSNSAIAIRLRRVGQNQFSNNNISRVQSNLHSQTYMHFPQYSDANKLQLPYKKITDILQINTFQS